jgi:AraC family transcriptional regulator
MHVHASPAKVGLAPVVNFAPASIARRQAVGWDGIEAESVEIVRHEPFDYRFQSSRHLLIAAERAARYEGETSVDGLPKSHLREFSGKLTFIPAGYRFYGWQKPRALMRTTLFYIDPHSVLFGPELRFAETQFKPRLFFFDRDLWETTRKLKAQVQRPGPRQRAYIDALSIALAHELVRMNHDASRAEIPVRGGLAGWQQKKLTEYIEGHLAEDISLSTLAQLAGLSPYHFARAFKQSFGAPPHRYLMTRRMEHAKALLAKPELSVTEIALDLGFRETSSFSAAFRKVTSQTPTDYRRSLE